MSQLTLHAVALGDFGHDWDRTLKTGDEEADKIQCIGPSTEDMIFVNLQGKTDSYQFADYEEEELPEIESAGVEAYVSVDTVGERVKLRLILPSTRQWSEITIQPVNTSPMLVQFFPSLAPNGNAWDKDAINEVQCLCWSAKIIGGANVKVHSLELKANPVE